MNSAGLSDRGQSVVSIFPMDLDRKSLLICEEALINEHGHFQSWIKAIRQMHLDAGAEVYVAGNRAVVPEVKANLDVLPVYSVNSWDQSVSAKWPAWRRQLSVFIHNWRVLSETRRALASTGPVDVLLFTAVRVHHVLGLRLLCYFALGRQFKKLVFFLLTSQAQYNSTFTSYRFPPQTRLLAIVLQSFRRLSRRGLVILAADSHITCAEYERLAGVSMTLFPSPGAALCYELPSNSNGGPVFTILGVSTWDKGIAVFQEAILRFLSRNPASSASFVLQWAVPCRGPDGNVIPISDRLRSEPRVVLLERRLSNQEYASYFSKSDFIVLPYRKSTYFNRISGVAVEAAVSGKPMIVTENTWLSWAMQEFGSGIAVPEDDVDSWCRAIEDCCAKGLSMQSEARRRMSVARAYNSSEKYLDMLWSEF
jgi:glycosyltransferase involved in cell wall biosynthesis